MNALKPITYRRLGKMGRCGNQLWQVASTVGIARTQGRPVALDPDWPYRAFLSCPDEWFSDSWVRGSDAHRYVDPNLMPPRWSPYLQHPALWSHVADEIRAAFAPSPRAVAVLESVPPPPHGAVAVHVRRGDTITNGVGFQPFCGVGYYRRAMALFDGPFHIYSDDPDWCRQHLDGEVKGIGKPTDPDARLRTGEPTDWADLLLMARYPHHIMSNSTYAWWSVWLSGDDRAVYPDRWYGDKLDNDWRAYIDPGWVDVATDSLEDVAAADGIPC